jgi:hypothetical protein
MLRTVRRWFSDAETKQLAEDVDRLADRFQDIGHKLEGMQLRIERHLNKLQMREARGARGTRDGLSAEDRAILDDLRAQSGEEPPPGRDPFYS